MDLRLSFRRHHGSKWWLTSAHCWQEGKNLGLGTGHSLSAPAPKRWARLRSLTFPSLEEPEVTSPSPFPPGCGLLVSIHCHCLIAQFSTSHLISPSDPHVRTWCRRVCTHLCVPACVCMCGWMGDRTGSKNDLVGDSNTFLDSSRC